ncbi:uncharacterized protein JCM6883_004119 [Sporobolomyces salmoneus]|uniref:uncharacterized protein n=1 Tax=Sporobolomyces salmoneus TaxID=183962 RepID=UPI0031799D65
MSETSTRSKPSSPSTPYYGLATQLRTPPADFSSSFPMSQSLSSSSNSNSKKITPAMRDEFGFNPKFVPQWSLKGQEAEESNAGRGGGGGGGNERSPSLGPKHSRTSGRHSTAPRPQHTPHLSVSTSPKQHRREDSLRDTPVFGKVNFNFKPMQQPLDLGVTLDPASASTTYQMNDSIAEEQEESNPPARSGSLGSSRKRSLLRKNDKSPALESSSLAKSQPPPPSPSIRPPPPMILPDSFAAAFPLSRTITPASKGTMNLITLARRTTHLSDVPGYGWRLNLLEKLEVLTGSFIAIRVAESILGIGNGQQPTASNSSKLESRKSQLFLPAATPKESHKLTKSKTSKPKADEHKSFFGKMMRRALSNPGSPQAKESAPPMPAPKRVVFGEKLSRVAEYGFVTSMIAGQRHDLPGVCFSTVEEIYRHGQGSKVPGLLQLAGEPGRVARLVQIFDAAPDYGEHHDLSVESIHNVCSLLKKYLHDLPEPVLDERVYRLFLTGCVDSTNPLPRRVASAQIILRLLPSSNFSLLVYLIAFLSQIPLFPSNSLPLSTVSALFGTSIMSPRKKRDSSASSSSHSLHRKPRADMIITGPTDLVDDQDGKKANQALEWLLVNWSAIADGLLEPDFDIEVDALGESTTPQLGASPPMIPLSPNVASPSSPRAAPAPPGGLFRLAPPVPVESQSPSVPSPSTDIPRYLDTLDDDDDAEEPRSDDQGANDDSLTETPRPRSDSSCHQKMSEASPLDFSLNNTGDEVVEFDDYSSVYSFPAPPTSLPPSTYHHRLPSLPPSPFLTQDEIALALAEQEKAVQSATIHQSSTFAPLNHHSPSDDGDDVDQTEDLDVSVMSPTTVPQLASPPSPARDLDLEEFEPKRKSISEFAAPNLVRTKSVQLEESRTLVLQQRLEIQDLWSKLGGLEAERTKERQEMIELTKEVEGFKQSLRRQVEEVDGGEQLRNELENVRAELRRSEEKREMERVKAREQVESLEKQLAEIRKVLVPLLGSGIQL